MRKIHAPERHNRVLTKNLYQGANVCLTHHKLCSFPIVLISAQAVPILHSSSAHRYRQGRKEELLLPLGPCTLRQKLLYSVKSQSLLSNAEANKFQQPEGSKSFNRFSACGQKQAPGTALPRGDSQRGRTKSCRAGQRHCPSLL